MTTAAATAPAIMSVPAMAATRPGLSRGRLLACGCLRCRGDESAFATAEWDDFRWRGTASDTASLQSERMGALCCHLGCWCVNQRRADAMRVQGDRVTARNRRARSVLSAHYDAPPDGSV